MQMRSYLAEMEHAVSSLIPMIWAEHEAAEAVAEKLRKYEAETRDGYARAKFLAINDLDDDGLATAIHWDTYFGADKQRYHADAELKQLQAGLENRAFSRGALASSLLQYAKQGISAVHGKFEGSPAGRPIHGHELKEVIWQGRNQALHWEEGNPHKAVVTCFEDLAEAVPALAEFRSRNLGFEVVQLLDWRDWDRFQADMLSLG